MSSPTPTLIDPFQRRIEYVRVSVTDRCDLRCSYCMPKGFDGFHEPTTGSPLAKSNAGLAPSDVWACSAFA
jgi:hypothetical protein